MNIEEVELIHDDTDEDASGEGYSVWCSCARSSGREEGLRLPRLKIKLPQLYSLATSLADPMLMLKSRSLRKSRRVHEMMIGSERKSWHERNRKQLILPFLKILIIFLHMKGMAFHYMSIIFFSFNFQIQIQINMKESKRGLSYFRMSVSTSIRYEFWTSPGSAISPCWSETTRYLFTTYISFCQ